jgi:hypothetical protein
MHEKVINCCMALFDPKIRLCVPRAFFTNLFMNNCFYVQFSWQHPCLAVAAPGSIELYQDQVSGLDKVGEGVPVQHVHLLLLQKPRKRVFASKDSAIWDTGKPAG